MCLGKHTLRRVGPNVHPEIPPDHTQRHGLDTVCNFFERSAWTPAALAHCGGVLILTRLTFSGVITLLVLLTGRPQESYRTASTRSCVATASWT